MSLHAKDEKIVSEIREIRETVGAIYGQTLVHREALVALHRRYKLRFEAQQGLPPSDEDRFLELYTNRLADLANVATQLTSDVQQFLGEIGARSRAAGQGLGDVNTDAFGGPK